MTQFTCYFALATTVAVLTAQEPQVVSPAVVTPVAEHTPLVGRTSPPSDIGYMEFPMVWEHAPRHPHCFGVARSGNRKVEF